MAHTIIERFEIPGAGSYYIQEDCEPNSAPWGGTYSVWKTGCRISGKMERLDSARDFVRMSAVNDLRSVIDKLEKELAFARAAYAELRPKDPLLRFKKEES